jgi:hypothetical protein
LWSRLARSATGLERLERRAARAELLGLLSCVFELRPRVGVDELTGLDALEAVAF